MIKTIIVYVCHKEFNDFDGEVKKIASYRYKIRYDDKSCFIVIMDLGDNSSFAEKQEVFTLLQTSDINGLCEKLAKYLRVIHRIIQVIFNCGPETQYQSVFVITHWGGEMVILLLTQWKIMLIKHSLNLKMIKIL